MSEVMQLCKGYDPKRLSFPVFVSEKLDGVPGVYTKDKLVSRQNKPLLGVQWIHERLAPYIPSNRIVIGEHYEKGQPFKYISGRVRAGEVYEEAELYIFDFIEHGYEQATLAFRYEELKQWHFFLPQQIRDFVHVVQQTVCHSDKCIQQFVEQFVPGLHEGVVARSMDAGFTLTRSWDSQKIVFDDLLDLRVIGFEEAISQSGEPMGMIGALWVDYQGAPVKVGAGKMSHIERKLVLENWHDYHGKICKVKAKVDATYNKLRQPTFQAWHEDKDVPDA